ncbi:cuticle protein 10.9 [Galendromus occidentalis]|uniref:Cuticle protein 10.9 n=1 Tax=Galendromus occidentalis TaxID=34638 RepID=A0AAJ6QSD4_9ACAR|nr:cuticle protein 10.9 [Galendromus occidentalis]
MRTLIVIALVGAASAQLYARQQEQYARQQEQYAPIPYKYAYSATGDEGSHSAEETSDGNGRVQGSYTIQLADGRVRTVSYVADENGFRPSISTNELGTESRAPADAAIQSSAITGEEAAIKYGPQYESRRLNRPL